MQSRNAVRLLDLCKMLSWENTLSAYLLAGAIAGAPICGALEWRPHIWICAPGGSGKTWIAENIIAPTIGPMLVNCAAKTTEPGVRRRLASDAFPVMIDEFEANDPMQMARCTSMMGLARSSSRETSAEILQGSTSGSSESFRVRSSFIFLSIGMSAHEYADLTRISVLTLRKNDATKQGIDHFNRIQDFRRELLTPEWIDSLHARMVSLIPIIRHNAEVFALAGAKIMGTRRLGDQIGALLANAYALVASSRVTPEVAAAWIERQDWREEREILHDMDGVHCFSRIMEHKVSVDGPHTTLRRSLGELVDAILDRGEYDEKLTKSEASATLRRYGVAVQPDKTLAISNTHSAIADILRGTPWAVNWARRLKQIDGAESYDGVLSFAGAKTRAVLIPTQA
jgi:putative DNA primase/helicase